MRRRRKRNSGLKWVVTLVVLGALGWYGLQFYKSRQATHVVAPAVPAPAQPATVSQPLPPPASAATTPTAAFMSEAEARDASIRAAREQTLRVQQRLREENRARQQALATPSESERCIDGQKMKRVANGWVQSGTCGARAADAATAEPAPVESAPAASASSDSGAGNSDSGDSASGE